jgi:hypothetical protein
MSQVTTLSHPSRELVDRQRSERVVAARHFSERAKQIGNLLLHVGRLADDQRAGQSFDDSRAADVGPGAGSIHLFEDRNQRPLVQFPRAGHQRREHVHARDIVVQRGRPISMRRDQNIAVASHNEQVAVNLPHQQIQHRPQTDTRQVARDQFVARQIGILQRRHTATSPANTITTANTAYHFRMNLNPLRDCAVDHLAKDYSNNFRHARQTA